MDVNDVEKLFDLKLAVMEEKIDAQFTIVNMQLTEMNKTQARVNSIWKWVLGIVSGILVSVGTAVLLAVIL